MNTRRRLVQALCLGCCWALALVVQAEANPLAGRASSGPNASEAVQAQRLGSFSIERLQRIGSDELKVFMHGTTQGYEAYKGRLAAPANSVTLWRVNYLSVLPERGQRSVRASGLLAIPDTATRELPLVSYQHGTVFEKDSVPSRPEQSIETRMAVLQFAAQGYAVLAADYFGMGDSELDNAYFLRDSTEQATFDLLLAGRKVLAQQGKQAGKLALFGWSQGAYNTMLLLRRLEREGMPVAAAVAAAAPADPALFIVRGITNPRPNEANYRSAAVSNMLFAFEQYRQVPGLAASAILPQYLAAARALYDFRIGFPEFLKQVPADPRDMLRPAFLEQLGLGQGRFFEILHESEGYRWKSRTPLRVYYGGQDEVVPVEVGRLAADYQAQLGKTNAQALSAGANADHRGTYIHALIDAKTWLDAQIR